MKLREVMYMNAEGVKKMLRSGASVSLGIGKEMTDP